MMSTVPFGEITSIESPLRSATTLSIGLLCSCLGIIIILPLGRSQASKYEPLMILSPSLRRSHPNVCGLPTAALTSVFTVLTLALALSQRLELIILSESSRFVIPSG
jgi:hypothetical protein